MDYVAQPPEATRTRFSTWTTAKQARKVYLDDVSILIYGRIAFNFDGHALNERRELSWGSLVLVALIGDLTGSSFVSSAGYAKELAHTSRSRPSILNDQAGNESPAS